MNKQSFNAFAKEVREITEYAIDNNRSSPINVVYMFRERLKGLLKREPGFDEQTWLAACRFVKTDNKLSGDG